MGKNNKKSAAKKIQRYWRKNRYRKQRAPKQTVSTGYIKCSQKFSRTELISASTGGSFSTSQEVYTLDQVPIANLTAFTRLFKFWKITKVEHTFIPKYIGDAGAPAGEPQPQLLIAGNFMSSITLDSNQLAPTTAPWANVDQAEESGNLKKKYLAVQTGKRSVAKVTLYPRLNNWVRTSADSTANKTVALGAKQWLSTQSPATQYFGLRWAYELLQAHPSFTIEIRTKMFYEFKGLN